MQACLQPEFLTSEEGTSQGKVRRPCLLATGGTPRRDDRRMAEILWYYGVKQESNFGLESAPWILT